MAKEVCVIFNADGEQWANYLQDQLSNPQTVNASVFLQKDTALFSGTIDTRSETRILNASAVIVIVTPGHMDFMISKRQATYDKICPAGDKSLLFFAGLSEDKITENSVIKYTKRIFPCFDYWSKVTYVDTESIRELLEKTVDIMDRPDPIQSKFTLCPSIVHCEEETKVVALTDKPIPENAEVRAVIRGAYTDDDLPCERVNPHAYSFVVPSGVEDIATVSIFVNRYPLSSQAEIYFKSYISCSDQTGVSEIYCHLLDRLCSFIQNEMKQSNASEAIDQKLSDVFDHVVDIPDAGYKKLFGVYKYLTEENGRTMIPTLVHLAAKYNLKDLAGCMQDLHDFGKALYLKNEEMKKPAEIAEMFGFKELATFFYDIEEQEELYSKMVYGDYHGSYQNTLRRSGSCNSSDYENPDIHDDTGGASVCVSSKPLIDEYYIDMNWKTREVEEADLPVSSDTGHMSSQQTSDELDLIMIQKQYRDGKLTIEEVESQFRDWKKKYFHHEEKSFQSKQAVLRTIIRTLSKLGIKTTKQKKYRSSKSLKTKQRDPVQDQKPNVSDESHPDKAAKPHSTPQFPPNGPLPVQPRMHQNTEHMSRQAVTSTDRFQMRTQETQQRYSDRSSNASTVSRTSNASSFSGRGSCTSGIEEDYDQNDCDRRRETRKSIHMLRISEPPEIPSMTEDSEYVLLDCDEESAPGTDKQSEESIRKIGAVKMSPTLEKSTGTSIQQKPPTRTKRPPKVPRKPSLR